MSDRSKGTLLGIIFSLGAVVLWIILSFAGYVAGLAGALMGILFLLGYRKMNSSDKSKYPVFIACVLIVIEIAIAELLTIAIIAAQNEVPFSFALSIPEVQIAIVIDLAIGFLLSFLVFGGYLFSLRKKDRLNNKRVYTGVNPTADPFSETTESKTENNTEIQK